MNSLLLPGANGFIGTFLFNEPYEDFETTALDCLLFLVVLAHKKVR